MTRNGTVLAMASLATVLTLYIPAPIVRADIYQWEYVNPANPALGKRESTTLTPGGAGAFAEPGTFLFGRNLTKAYLIGADLGGYWVDGGESGQGHYVLSDLSAVNFTEADLTNAKISLCYLSGTDFTNAEVRGAQFTGFAFTPAQLASTASYQAHDLTGIGFSNNNLTDWNLAGQNLTNATFRYATLTGVNFANAVVRGASFDRNEFLGGTGITAAQLATTAGYQNHDLVGIKLNENNFSGANLAGQNLTDADFYGANLNNANFSQANLSSASFVNAKLTGANLNQANLAGAIFFDATMTGATMAGADVRGAAFSVISTAQLYSTASYLAHDLTGIGLSGNNLAGANFAGQNLAYAGLSGATLTNANFSQANLTNAGFHQANLAGANFAGATIRGANFTDYGAGGISKSQLYSTASYEAHDLSGIVLDGNNLKGVNFAGQNLTEANLSTSTLTNGNFSQAILDGADFSGASVNNANLSQANLANASFYFAFLTGTNLTSAEVRGANFYCDSDPLGDYGSGLTVAQLHSTASYAAHDLRGIGLAGNNLAGVNLAGQNLANAQFATTFDRDGAQLTGASFVQANLTNVNFYYAKLHNANLSQANLSNANFRQADLSGANLTGAEVRGADFSHDGNSEMLSLAQLYSTASYQSHDLTGINLGGLGLAGANLAGQNLLNATFVPGGADLAGANLSRANLTNVVFATSNLTGGDLRQANLTGARLGYQEGHYGGANLTGANLSQANLTNASFAGLLVSDEWGGVSILPGADLTNANLSSADARGADFQYATLTGANTNNLIKADGHIAGLNLTAGKSLVVRDYDGNPTASPPIGPLPIVVDQSAAMNATGTLQLVFDADAWDSTISFAAGIPVTRAGTLELLFAPEVNLATQIGRTIDLFNWTGITPIGTFTVSSPYSWNLTNLYTTGEVTLTAVPGIVPGDFNNDSKVDAADYITWRKNGGTTAAYDTWRAHFGQTTGSGSALPSAEPLSAAVPEPTSLVLVALCGAVFAIRRARRVGIGMCLFAALFFPAAAQAVSYIVTDLGALGGTDSMAWAMNNHGQVTGYAATTDDLSIEGFLWTPTSPNSPSGSMLGLESLHGIGSWATGINSSGQVAGVSFEDEEDGNEHATLWIPTTPNGTSGTLHDLGTLGGTYSEAHGINDVGQVSGAADVTGDSATHAFMWKPTTPNGAIGTMYDLGSLGGSFTIGWDVNASGAVTGGSDLPDDAGAHAFLWKPTASNGTSGTMHDLGTLGGTDSDAYGINHSGQVTGYSQTTDDAAYRAFLWTPTAPGGISGVMQDLGSLGGLNSYGLAVTAGGTVVGASEVAAEVSNYTHAFVYTPGGGMVDLNTLVDPLSGWELLDADDINDAGQITGQGLINGEYHAFLLTPIQVPGDFNHDGAVDAADYVVWRKGVGVAPTPDNYNLWRGHFGQTAGGGSGPTGSARADAVVPEPNAVILCVICTPLLLRRRPH